MTLALNGKSRRRQLILLIAAIASVALATLGGATLRSAGQAEANTGWKSPTEWEYSAVSGHTGWNDPTGAFSSGGLAANRFFTPGGALVLKDFGIVLSTATDATGIAVNVTVRTLAGGASIGCQLRVALSSDAGAIYSTRQDITSFSSEFAVVSLGGPTGLWGRSGWSSDDLSNANFRVRLLTSGTNCASLGDVHVGHVEVQVYFEQTALPDLTVTKQAFVDGSPVSQVEVGQTFQWVWTIGNIGNADAVFDQFLYPLQDDLPVVHLDTLPAYGTPVLSGPHSAGATCAFTDTSGNTRSLRCQVDDGATVTIPANTADAFIVTLDVTPSAAGTLENVSQRCANLSGVPETTFDNNDCSHTVTVVESSTPETREITFQKMVPNPDGGWIEDNQATFWGFRHSNAGDYNTATDIENGASATVLATDSVNVWEFVPEGWKLVGVSATTSGTCSPQGWAVARNNTGPIVSTLYGIPAGSLDTLFCFYNERDLQPVTVEKTGTGEYTTSWSITKTVTPVTLNLPDDGNGESDYTVTVDKTVSGIEAGGTITITNPNPVAIQVNISDPNVFLNPPVCANNPVSVPANGSIECLWLDSSFTEVPGDYTNTVTVSGPWEGADVVATTPVIVFSNDKGPEQVTVNDNFAGNVTGGTKPNGNVVSEDTTYTYTATHTCVEGVRWNVETGIGDKTVENTATITDGQTVIDSDSADVDITCQRPKLTLIKNVQGGDAAPGAWELSADGSPVVQGTSGVFGYVPSGPSFTLTESDVAGYTLDSIACVVGGQSYDIPLTNGSGSIQLFGGAQDTTCTFYNVADQALTITKTATGTYQDVWDWTIDKEGPAGPLEYAAGTPFGVTYTTTSTPEKVGRTNGTVSGTVTIINNFDVSVSISDSLGDLDILVCNAGGDSIDNPGSGFTVPANGSVECSYTIFDAATSATTNTVTVTSTSHDDLGGSDTATIDWSSVNNSTEAFLEDTDNLDSSPETFEYTKVASETPLVRLYNRSFQCPAWPNEVYYNNGVFTGSHTFDIVNTAVLYKNDSLSGDEWDSDTHTVAVTCIVVPGSVEVDKAIDWNGVETNRPAASFQLCISNPIDGGQQGVTDFIANLTNGFAPGSAPAGSDWLECQTVSTTTSLTTTFDNLVPGWYVVAEKNPGTAWAQTSGPLPVYIDPGQSVRLLGGDGIENEYQRGELTVTKNTVLMGGELPAGSEFTVCIEGPSYPNGDEAGACNVFTSADPVVTWVSLIPGAYVVTETNTEPAGVQWATTITSNGNVNVLAGGEASVTVTNTLITGDLAVTKVINWSGYTPDESDLDGNPWPGFEICIAGPSYPNGDEAGACQVVTNVNGETLQWDNLAAGTYTVTETDPGTQWEVVVDPAGAGTAGVVTCAPTDDECETPQVVIINTLARAELTICKDFVGENDNVLPGITVDGQSIETPWGVEDCFTIDVAPYTPLTVAELLPLGYLPAQEPILSGQCTIQPVEVDVASFLIAQTLSFLGLELNADWLFADLTGIPAGESCTVTSTNEPVGELIIVKEDNVNTEEPVTWFFDVETGEVSDTAVIIGSGSDSNTVGTGIYTVSEREVEGLNRVEICEITSPAGSYQVRVQVNDAGPLFSTSAEVAVARGETTTVTFFNDDCGRVLGGANLFVHKFAAAGPNVYGGTEGLAGWTMTLECLAGACETGGFPAALPTDGAGLASFIQVPSGVYEVCEVPQAGFNVVGSLLNGGAPVGGTCREVSVTEAAADPEGNVVVDFFNYRIPETATPTPENTPTVTPTPIIPVFPTSTPTTPPSTSTPVDPTSTPVVPTSTPDPVDPTATPTPIDEVEGEITPGASPTTPASSATPIPPASGTGNGPGGGVAMLLALTGALAILSGATSLVAARRR